LRSCCEAVWTAWKGVGEESTNLRKPRAFFKDASVVDGFSLGSIFVDKGGDGLG
jgi:hypothetical protein